MMNDICYVTETVASCDGNNAASGHPRVFLNLGDDGKVDCPYCGRHFIFVEDAKKAGNN